MGANSLKFEHGFYLTLHSTYLRSHSFRYIHLCMYLESDLMVFLSVNLISPARILWAVFLHDNVQTVGTNFVSQMWQSDMARAVKKFPQICNMSTQMYISFFSFSFFFREELFSIF